MANGVTHIPRFSIALSSIASILVTVPFANNGLRSQLSG